MKYDVFISYSRKDVLQDDNHTFNKGCIISKILDRLEKENITYWIDIEGIYTGTQFAEKISTAIEDSRTFVFISSANSNQSSWTSGEIASAIQYSKPIIPVKIDSTPYNKKIQIFIAALDYIEVKSNINQSIELLIDSIKKHLEEINRHEEIEQLKIQEEKNKINEEQIKKKEHEALCNKLNAQYDFLNNQIQILFSQKANLQKKMIEAGMVIQNDSVENKGEDESLIKQQSKYIEEKNSEISYLRNTLNIKEKRCKELEQKYKNLSKWDFIVGKFFQFIKIIFAGIIIIILLFLFLADISK